MKKNGKKLLYFNLISAIHPNYDNIGVKFDDYCHPILKEYKIYRKNRNNLKINRNILKKNLGGK